MVSALPSVKVLVTGGGGFLGRYLCQTLLRRKRLNGRALDSIAILDTGADTHVPCDTKVQVFPHGPTNQASSAIRVENFRGDITDRKLVEKAMQPGSEGGHVTIFHLASVMSGEGEEEFDKCVAVNLDGTQNLLEKARALHASGRVGEKPVRFVFPSSFAAFGPHPEVSDETKLTPQSTYGMTKAVGELMVNDYTRKGWVDGRTGRLPTVIVRPGNKNGASTGCFSAVVRELLMGHDYVIPYDPRQTHPVISTRRTIKGLLALAEVEGESLGGDRSVNLPALQTTMEELLFHTRQIAQGRGIPMGEVSVKIDPWVSGIVGRFPQVMRSPRAETLGLPRDGSVEAVIEDYVDVFLDDEMKDDYPLFSI